MLQGSENRYRFQLVGLGFLFCLIVWGWNSGQTVAEDLGFRIRISLPVNSATEKNFQRDLLKLEERIKANPANSVSLVVAFDTSNNITGEGSSFESSLAIARSLQAPQMRGIRKIAYIPPATGLSASAARDLNVKPVSTLAGHAVLVAMACDELWMDQSATLNAVGGKQEDIELLLPNYKTIARRGLQLPEAIVQLLVDNTEGLFRVTKPDGAKVLVGEAGRRQLNQDNQEIASDELVGPDLLVELPAEKLASWGVIQPPVLGAEDLLNRVPGKQLINLSLNTQQQEWKAAHLEVTHVDPAFVHWSSRSLASEAAVDDTNLLFLTINTLGAADFQSASSFVDALLGMDRESMHLVALLPEGASGPETLIALACDEIVIAEGTQFGGRQTLPVDDEALLEQLDQQARSVAVATGRDWSLVAGLALGNVTVNEYRNRKSGGIRLLTEQQWKDLPDQQDWQSQGAFTLANGLSAEEAMRRGIVNQLLKDTSTAIEVYGLESWREVAPTVTDRGIQQFADFLTHPMVSSLLLFIAMFALMSEFSVPGLGLPGFVSACCFTLFFWAHFMEGNADLLEILLFGLGILFVLIELFVVPGFGIFGLGGGLMILTSIVLASQSFAIPANSAEVNEMAMSVVVLFCGMLGVFSALLFMRYYLDQIPFLNRMILEPPGAESIDGESIAENPSRFAALLDRTGVAVTSLRPSGKAKFGNEIVDVISDGRMIDQNQTIRVYEVTGTVVKVEPKET